MSSTSSLRVRFAPSPTGMFHVGGARSALFDWVMAKQSGGTLVLQIEETDASRNSLGWLEGVSRAVAWLGMADKRSEGPYFQSATAERHAEAAERPRDAGRAYYCDCSRETIVASTGEQHRGYDGFCRNRGLDAG